MLIDDFLPDFDVSERHEISVEAHPDRAYAAVKDLDLGRSRGIRALFALRGLPSQSHMNLDALFGLGFVLLGEEPGTEIVVGVVGKPWRPKGGVVRVKPKEFASFDRPGYAKAAWNFRVDEHEGSSVVSTDTRVLATDEEARRAFRRYWRVIGPFSGLIRRRALALIREDAERT